MANQGPPSAGYKFNTFEEIKSHSSILYNERMAILFYMLDMRSITVNSNPTVDIVLEVYGIIWQIYKNIRMLIRMNPTVRATLNLETKDEGIYITDFALGRIDKMIQWCENNEWTTKRLFIIIQEMNRVEMIMKDILQYFHYFIRPDFRQKPDIQIATEKYKEIVDKQTLEELREIVGKRNLVDFEGLGTSRVELNVEDDFDKKDDVIDNDDIEEEYSYKYNMDSEYEQDSELPM